MSKAKIVEKNETSKTSNETKIVDADSERFEQQTKSDVRSKIKAPRIQTAEGWKRSMLKAKKQA